MYAEIAVNVAGLAGTFHYEIPSDLEASLAAGHLVTVPFGSRDAQGIVVGLSDDAPVEHTRPVIGLIDPTPVLTRPQLDLAYWISHTYLVPLVEALTLMLPPGLAKQAETRYTLAEAEGAEASRLNPAQQAVVEALRARGALSARQLDRALPKTRWRPAADALVRRGVLTRYSRLEAPSVRAKQVRFARLLATPAQLAEARGRLSRSEAKAERLQRALDYLAQEGKPTEVAWVYAASGCSLADLRDLEAR